MYAQFPQVGFHLFTTKSKPYLEPGRKNCGMIFQMSSGKMLLNMHMQGFINSNLVKVLIGPKVRITKIYNKFDPICEKCNWTLCNSRTAIFKTSSDITGTPMEPDVITAILFFSQLPGNVPQ